MGSPPSGRRDRRVVVGVVGVVSEGEEGGMVMSLLEVAFAFFRGEGASDVLVVVVASWVEEDGGGEGQDSRLRFEFSFFLLVFSSLSFSTCSSSFAFSSTFVPFPF